MIVAVIDSGIDFSHPDLAANIWRNPNETGNGTDSDGNGFVDDLNGWDFGDLDNDPSEDINTASWYGHGTFVSGIIGAVGNNGVGIAGVAWDVSIIPMKIPNSNGNALLSAIVGAHDYLTMMIGEGHNIVASNNSYGAFDQAFYADVPTGFDAERDAIERFIAAGGTFVAASGNNAFDNDDPDVTFFPTSYNIPGLIAVAATDNNDALAGFSNYGAKTVDLGAPGVQVYSTTVGGGYGFGSGTSFAAPMVVGAVALLKTHRPAASAQEVRQTLIDSVDILPTLQNRVVSGGRLNLVRALNIIGIDGPVVKRIDPGPVTGRNDPSTGLPIDTITVEFNKSIDASVLALDSASFLYAGPDGLFGTGDDSTVITIASVDIDPADDKIIHISLDLTNVPQQRLLLGKYRLTLHAGTAGDPKIRDLLGNLLKGDSTGGADEVYEFEVVASGAASNRTTPSPPQPRSPSTPAARRTSPGCSSATACTPGWTSTSSASRCLAADSSPPASMPRASRSLRSSTPTSDSSTPSATNWPSTTSSTGRTPISTTSSPPAAPISPPSPASPTTTSTPPSPAAA